MATTVLKFTAVGLLLIVVVVGVFWRSGQNRKDTRQVYYFEEASQRVFVDTAAAIPPIPSPGQPGGDEPSGVRAYIFACESCAPTYDGMTLDEVQRHGGFVAWFEKYTPEGQRLLANGEGLDDQADFETGTRYKLIRSPGNEQWVQAESRAANMIRAALGSRCGDRSPKMCRPAAE